MAKKGKGFLGLGWVISLILVIFYPVGWIFAVIERISRGKILGGILCIFAYGFGILWICDLITLITSQDIKVLA